MYRAPIRLLSEEPILPLNPDSASIGPYRWYDNYMMCLIETVSFSSEHMGRYSPRGDLEENERSHNAKRK